MSQYHLFTGERDYDYTETVEGMNAYRGVFESYEAAYEVVKPVLEDTWAQLVCVNPSDGRLYELAALIDRIQSPDENQKIIITGWLITVSSTFIEMERRYETLESVDWTPTFNAIKEQGIGGVTGMFPSHRWIKSDPF